MSLSFPAANIPVSATEADALISVAAELAEAARRAILPLFRTTGLTVDNKAVAGFDPVTAADRAAEQAMRSVLARSRPRDGIRGEEFGCVEGTSGLVWVLDPIDGTRAFIAGAPTWGVLIGLCDASGPIFGLIDQPHTGERWTGGLGTASLETPHGISALATRQGRSLEQALLVSTFPEIGTPEERTAFERVSGRVGLVRYGMDCYGYGLLAAGHVDLVIEAGLQDYDVCAPIAVIAAAGGIVTDWTGGPAHHGGRVLAAANPELHAAALSLLAGG